MKMENISNISYSNQSYCTLNIIYLKICLFGSFLYIINMYININIIYMKYNTDNPLNLFVYWNSSYEGFKNVMCCSAL